MCNEIDMPLLQNRSEKNILERYVETTEKKREQAANRSSQFCTWNQASLLNIFKPFHNEREYRAMKMEITARNIQANNIKEAKT